MSTRASQSTHTHKHAHLFCPSVCWPELLQTGREASVPKDAPHLSQQSQGKTEKKLVDLF